MTTASVPFIRPLSLGELLDQAIRLYRRHFLTLIGIIAIPYIPLGLLSAYMQYLTSTAQQEILGYSDPMQMFGNPTYWTAILGSLLVSFLHFILVSGVATAAMTRVVADGYTGRQLGIMEAYSQLGNSWLRLIGALLAMALISIAAIIWFIIPCIGWLTGLGIFYFLSAVVTQLLVPVVILEKQGGFGAIRRAWDLGRIRFWWILGFAFVVGLLGQIIVAVPVYIVTFGLNAILGSQLDPMQSMRITTMASSMMGVFTNLLYLPLQLTAMIVVYFDLRVRSEGLDLALQAASAMDPEANITLLAETTPAKPQDSFVTGTDAAQFFLLSLIFIALYFLLVGIGMAAFLPFMSSMGF